MNILEISHRDAVVSTSVLYSISKYILHIVFIIMYNKVLFNWSCLQYNVFISQCYYTSYYIYVKEITAFMKVCILHSLCLKQHLSTSVSPCWKQRAECACFHSIFPKTNFKPCVFFSFSASLLLTSATLCVELKRAVSPARTQCWWELFRSSGKYREEETDESEHSTSATK